MIFRSLAFFMFVVFFPLDVSASTEKTAYQAESFQPFETRDQNVFNLIHGQALPTSARLNKKTQGLWSTSLIITNTLNIESKHNESIYLDYES